MRRSPRRPPSCPTRVGIVADLLQDRICQRQALHHGSGGSPVAYPHGEESGFRAFVELLSAKIEALPPLIVSLTAHQLLPPTH